MKMPGIAVVLLSVVALLPSSFLVGQSIERATLRIRGSDTMAKLTERLTTTYAETTDALFSIDSQGSEFGIRELMAGKAEIAAASRAMTTTERKRFAERWKAPPVEHVVALDGIGVYVHETNRVLALSVKELRDILTGKITNWSEVGGANRKIIIYNRDERSGTRTFVSTHVLNGEPFASTAINVTSSANLMYRVARDPKGIAYAGVGYASGAHILRLKKRGDQVGVTPNPSTVGSDEYPLSRPLYFYTRSDAKPHVLAFVEWVKDTDGQRIVEETGFFGTKAAGEARESSSRKPDSGVTEGIGMLGYAEILPDTAKEHGFAIKASMRPEVLNDENGRMIVTVKFERSGGSIDRVRRFVVAIGSQAEIPVSAGIELTVTMTVARSLLDDVVLKLYTAATSTPSQEYRIPIRPFL